MSLRMAALTAIVAISAIASAASAQNYPTKPIHLIVPYPAGGGTDFFARLVGQKMSELVASRLWSRTSRGGDQSRRRFRRQGATRRLHHAAR